MDLPATVSAKEREREIAGRGGGDWARDFARVLGERRDLRVQRSEESLRE